MELSICMSLPLAYILYIGSDVHNMLFLSMCQEFITTLMTTKRSLTSPRPIKRESTQMRFIKMGMTDKTTPSREMTSRPIKRGSTPIEEEITKERSIITPFREITSTRAMTSTTVGRVREMTKTIPTTEMVSERMVLDGVTLRRPFSKQKNGVLVFFTVHMICPSNMKRKLSYGSYWLL